MNLNDSKENNKNYWHEISVEETILELKSSTNGLDKQEAKERLKTNGLNTNVVSLLVVRMLVHIVGDA